jgi:hypothetical protein
MVRGAKKKSSAAKSKKVHKHYKDGTPAPTEDRATDYPGPRVRRKR